MDQTTLGFVIGIRPLSETSLIVHWLTRDFGRLSTVAKGARRPKSPFRGKLDLFFLCELFYLPSRKSNLHTLKEIKLLETFPALRKEVEKLQQASYAVSLIKQSTEQDTPLMEVFLLFQEFLQAIASSSKSAPWTEALELRLLDLLGFDPTLPLQRHSLEIQGLAKQLQSTPWDELGEVTLGPGPIQTLQQFLHGFFIHHLGRLPSGRNAVTLKGGSTNSAE